MLKAKKKEDNNISRLNISGIIFSCYDKESYNYNLDAFCAQETCRELLIEDILESIDMYENLVLFIGSEKYKTPPELKFLNNKATLEVVKKFSKKCFNLYAKLVLNETTRKKAMNLFSDWKYEESTTKLGDTKSGLIIKFCFKDVKDFPNLILSIFLGIVRQSILMYSENQKAFYEINDCINNVRITSSEKANEYLIKVMEKTSERFIGDYGSFPLLYLPSVKDLNRIGSLIKQRNRKLINYLYDKEIYVGNDELPVTKKLEELKFSGPFGIYSLASRSCEFIHK